MRIGAVIAAGLLVAGLNAHASPKPASLAGEWRGKYECGQGVTALTLTVSEIPGGKLKARFAFGPLPENPRVPTGAFDMEGRLDAKTRRVTFRSGKWIKAPLGYFTVDLEGYVEASGNRITGVVPSAGCSVFDLARGEALVG
ncbi:MAG: hypothetical protein ABI740_09070 [Alphaproteobacteria bacterium]